MAQLYRNFTEPYSLFQYGDVKSVMSRCGTAEIIAREPSLMRFKPLRRVAVVPHWKRSRLGFFASRLDARSIGFWVGMR